MGNSDLINQSADLEFPHRIAIPPSKPFLKHLKSTMKETFLPDDPFHKFKNEPPFRKFVLGLEYFLPMLEWAPSYAVNFFKSDLIAGITIASLAIPQGISYAKLANLPPILGLYSSFVPPLVYAMLGSSKDLAVGTVAVPSLLLGSILGNELSPTENPHLYLHLALTATFFAGVLHAALGLLRLGFIVDFLSHATIVGFMGGAATVVILQQLKGVLGLEHFTHATDLVSVMHSIFSQIQQWRWESVVFGCCFLFFLLVTKHISKKRPKYFWVSAMSPLTSVILGSILVYFTQADKHGVQVGPSIIFFFTLLRGIYWAAINFPGSNGAHGTIGVISMDSEACSWPGELDLEEFRGSVTFRNTFGRDMVSAFEGAVTAGQNITSVADRFCAVSGTPNLSKYLSSAGSASSSEFNTGHLKKGLNPLSFNDLAFGSPYLKTTIRAGLVTGIISLAEGIAVGRSFAMFKNYHIDGNKEMVAFGMMNIVGSCFSCYLTTGLFSRTAVNFNAGCKTAMSNIVMAIAVMITLLFLTPLFHYTPFVVLSSIIISAMLGLIDVAAAIHLFKLDKFDFLECVAAYFGVVLASVEIGLILGVALSMVRMLLSVARPKTFNLGNIPNSMIYRDVDQYPIAVRVPGILTLQIDAPIYFTNASYLRERITRWINDEEERVQASGEINLQYVILDMGAVGRIDTSGLSMLKDVHKIIDRKKLKLVFANPGSELLKKLDKSNFIEDIGQDWIYLTVGEAVRASSSTRVDQNLPKRAQLNQMTMSSYSLLIPFPRNEECRSMFDVIHIVGIGSNNDMASKKNRVKG